MSGFDFEECVADMLKKLGYGQVEKVLFTQDEGRDILIRSDEGLIVVECKHQPRSRIGRPIVQKLHSAVISSQAVKGMLVTTGHFTSEAIEYAKSLVKSGTSIEMVDRHILADMANRAKIKLVGRGESLNIWTYSLPSEEETHGSLGSFVGSITESNPRPPEELLVVEHKTVEYRPLYVVTYNINAVFETNVGIIHTERASNAHLLFDGNKGELYASQVAQFLESEPQIKFSGTHHALHDKFPIFQVDYTTLQKRARAAIAQLHTRRVRYTGRNNVSYSKICEPGERDIYVSDVRQLYLPLVHIDFRLIVTAYQIDCVQAPSGRLLSLSNDVPQCRVCRGYMNKKGLLCDTCGSVTHSGGLRLRSVHGFRCGRCKRTTCRNDGYWIRKFLLWRQLLCPQCSDIARNKGKEPKELGPA
jgi:restriction system protein